MLRPVVVAIGFLVLICGLISGIAAGLALMIISVVGV